MTQPLSARAEAGTIMLQMAAADAEHQKWEGRWKALIQMYPRERPCFVDRDGDWCLRDALEYLGEVSGFAHQQETDNGN